MKQLLTHSRMQSFKKCQRHHELAYEIGIKPEREADYFRFGGAWHKCQELHGNGAPLAVITDVIHENYANPPEWVQRDEKLMHKWFCEPITVLALFEHYLEFWKNDPIEPVASEIEFRIPLINPRTGHASTLFDFAGKIDKICLYRNRLAVKEYKTTSDDIGPDSDYWLRLRIDTQISGYYIAARMAGHAVETVLYDVMRKPAIRPTSGGKLMDLADWQAKLNDYVGEDPAKYFARKEIPRLNDDLVLYQSEMWDIAQDIRKAQHRGKWYRNTNSCRTFGGSCEFFHLCSQCIPVSVDNVPAGFKLSKPHSELETI